MMASSIVIAVIMFLPAGVTLVEMGIVPTWSYGVAEVVLSHVFHCIAGVRGRQPWVAQGSASWHRDDMPALRDGPARF